MKFWFFTGLLSLVFFQGYAQQATIADKGCGTITTPQEMQELADFIANQHTRAKTTNGVDTIPLKLHVVSRNDGSGRYRLDYLTTVICQLNTRFAPVGFYFYVKFPINFIKNDNYFIHDFWNGAAMMNQYNVPNTANIYFVQDPNGACGYFAPSADGIAIGKSCADPNNTTVTHELGHYFGLPHTFVGWENGGTPSNPERVTRGAGANCNSAGDMFCDTDADYQSNRWNCPYTGTKLDPLGVPYDPDSSLYMGYAQDACMTRFSNQQIARMQQRVTSGNRTNLLNGKPSGAATLSTPNIIYPAGTMYTNLRDVRWNRVPGAQAYYVRTGFQIGSSIRQDTITTDTVFTINVSMVNNGYYSLTVTPLSDINLCGANAKQVNFVFTDAITNVANIAPQNNAISLFPNPAHHTVSLKLNAMAGDYQVQITNLNGQKVWEQALHLTAPNAETSISTANLPSGMYMVKVSGNNGIWTQKLLVQH